MSIVNEKNTRSEFVFRIMVVLVSIFVFFIVAYPLYFIVIASVSNASLVNQGEVILWPKGFSLFGYNKIFHDSRIGIGYINTFIYAAGGTAVNLAVTLPAAYVLSRRNFRARKVIMLLFVFTMYFSGGMIPSYLLVRDLHLINTRWSMILPTALSVYNLIITRTFMETSISDELYEAAILDGCSHFRYFISIVIPLSKAVISVIFLYYMVQHWNDFFTALLYLNKDSLQPLQTVLRNILLSNLQMEGQVSLGGLTQQQYVEQIKYGVIIVSTLPVLCIYPFIQKYFEKGVMIGAVKG